MKASTLRCALAGAVLSLSTLGAEFDSNFLADVSGPVTSIALAPDGSILIAGSSTAYHLDPTGARIAEYSANAPVNCVVATVNEVCFAGRFSEFLGSRAAGVFSTAGDLPPVNGGVDALAIDSRERLLLGGSFSSIGGVERFCLARITPEGTLDAHFQPDLYPTTAIEAGIMSLGLQPDGKLLVGGIFATPKGFGRIARLNQNGSFDETFQPVVDAVLYVRAIQPLSSGAILIGGQSKNGRGFVSRLGADGSIDATFQAPAFDSPVRALAVDPAGRVLVGSRGIVRLRTDGLIDETWQLNIDAVITAITLDSSGRILVGGSSGLWRVLSGSSLNPLGASKTFRGSLKVDAGRTYLIETSSDLVTWRPVGSETTSSTLLGVIDEDAFAWKRRFFRARAMTTSHSLSQ